MPILYEYYATGDDAFGDYYGAIWGAQTFTVGSAGHTVTSVKLKLFRTGNPGTVTVSIRATDASGKPTGNDLTSGTIDGDTLTASSAGEWREITLTEYTLSASTKYAIIIRATSGNSSNKVHWRGDQTSPTYADGTFGESTNSGSSWTMYTTVDGMFEVWGNPLATLQTVAEALSLSDAVLRNKMVLPITQTISLSDVVLCSKIFSVSDAIGVVDAVKGNKNPLIVADLVSLADLISVISETMLKTVIDAIGAADMVLVNKTAVIADCVNLLEQVFRHKPAVLVSDVAYASEIILTTRLLTVGDSVNLADVGAVLKTLNVSDTLTLVDSASTPSRVLQALDSLSLADNVAVNKLLQIAETINLVETVQVGVGGVKKTKLFLFLGDVAVQLTGE